MYMRKNPQRKQNEKNEMTEISNCLSACLFIFPDGTIIITAAFTFHWMYSIFYTYLPLNVF